MKCPSIDMPRLMPGFVLTFNNRLGVEGVIVALIPALTQEH